MDTPDALRRHLNTLTEALDIPGADLQAMLEVLIDDITIAVPSFLGLRITITASAVITRLDTADGQLMPTARASLLLPLHRIIGAANADTMILYAAEPGAFADLATTTREAFDLDGQILVDHHLPSALGPTHPRSVNAEDATVINIAVGILIDQGQLPEQAHVELTRRATQHDDNLAAAAREILQSMSRSESSDGAANA